MIAYAMADTGWSVQCSRQAVVIGLDPYHQTFAVAYTTKMGAQPKWARCERKLPTKIQYGARILFFGCALFIITLSSQESESAQPAMLVNKATRWCLGFVNVLRPQQARVHAIGAALHLSMVMLSCIGEVLSTAADGAMCGDSLRASQSCNLCKALTGMRGLDALPTATARKCHDSSDLALVWCRLSHDACMSCL